MKLLLTDRFCDRVKSLEAAQTDYFDATVSGLALRVSAKRKSWTLHYVSNGRQRRLTFGAYPTISLAAARRMALEAKGDVAEGLDPAAKPDTLQAIGEEYIRRENKLRSIGYQETALKRLVYPTLGARPIGDIRRTEIVRLLDQIEDENGPVMADRTMAILRRIMNWHASRSDDFRSPIVRGMARARNQARDRTLTDDEIRVLWKASENGMFGRYLRFLLLIGARRAEAAGMAWAELDGTEWTLPAARNKTKIDFVRPLSKAALATLPERNGELVFDMSRGAIGHAKEEFDKTVPLPHWTLHDLRRTARSLMSRAGVASDHAERCLGHVIGGVRGVYDRHEYYEEKKRAFEALASQVERIVNPQDNVVAMGRSR
jgi:integrase